MRPTPVPQEIYRHFKGNLYQIITIAEHSETGEQLVVYQALYGDFKAYVRPLAVFMEKTDKQKYPEAVQEYRFERLEKGMLSESKDCQNVQEIQDVQETQNKQVPQNAQKIQNAQESQDVQAAQNIQESSDVQETHNIQEPQEEGEVNLDPMVIEFLDASSYDERLNILSGLHHKITDDMIDIMSAAMDIEVKPGDIEERYAEFRSCLALMGRFECNRLR